MNVEPLTTEEEKLLRFARSINGGLADAGPVETIDRLLATLEAARSASPVDRAGPVLDIETIAAAMADPLVGPLVDKLLGRSPVDREDELDRLARFVGRVAGMGLCSQTHHEYIVREAAALAARSKDPSDARQTEGGTEE